MLLAGEGVESALPLGPWGRSPLHGPASL